MASRHTRPRAAPDREAPAARSPLAGQTRLRWIAGIALICLTAGCPSEAQRCENLAALAAARIAALGQGCGSAGDCMPLAGACGAPTAVRLDADTREVTRILERYESRCGCDGGPPVLGPAACVSGVCVPESAAPSRPPECEVLREDMIRDVDRQNRCATDDDCTTFEIDTCPPVCGQATALTADPSRVTALLLEYNGIEGCRDCEPSCPRPMAPRCAFGLCAGHVELPSGCDSLAAEMDRLRRVRSCLAYADCARVGFGALLDDRCGAPVARAVAPRLTVIAQAWRESCCASCPPCEARPLADGLTTARCETGRCIDAQACPRRLAESTGWTLTYRTAALGDDRTLVLRHDRLAVVSPPGVQGTLSAAELSQVVRRLDEAAVLCLDSSFHREGPTDEELTADVPGVTLLALRYASTDPRPSGLREVERRLQDVMASLGGAP